MPPTATPNRFGVLAGDNQGFPNGRRLADDVTDIELRVIAGALVPAEQGGKQIPLGDGVDQNEKPFRTTFPYVAHVRQRLRRQVRAYRARPRAGPAAADAVKFLALIALAFGAGLAVLSLGGGGAPAPAAVQRPVLRGGGADDVAKLQSAVRSGRDDLRPTLAAAYLQRVRDTGDPSFYTRAEGVLRTPRTPDGFATAGELALARHDFGGALELGRRAGTFGASCASTRWSSSAATTRPSASCRR